MAWITWIFMLIMHLLFTVSQGVEVESICPVFVDKETVTIECRINSSEIVMPRCLANPTNVSYFFTTPLGITSNSLCIADFPTTTCNIPKSGCGCISKSGFMYIYNYIFTANESLHMNGSFKCNVNCFLPSPPLTQNHSSCAFITFAPPTTSPPVFNITSTPTTPPPPPPFPGLKIALIVIGIIVCIVIIIIIVVCIVKKCKKEKQRGNRFHCCSHKKRNKRCCPCGFYPEDESSSNHVHIFHCCSHKKCNSDGESSSSDESSSNNVPTRPSAPRASNRIEIPTITPAAQDGKKWTESIPTTAPGGNNGTEQTAHL